MKKLFSCNTKKRFWNSQSTYREKKPNSWIAPKNSHRIHRHENLRFLFKFILRRYWQTTKNLLYFISAWGRSSSGRALHSHCRGSEFESHRLHQKTVHIKCTVFFILKRLKKDVFFTTKSKHSGNIFVSERAAAAEWRTNLFVDIKKGAVKNEVHLQKRLTFGVHVIFTAPFTDFTRINSLLFIKHIWIAVLLCLYFFKNASTASLTICAWEMPSRTHLALNSSTISLGRQAVIAPYVFAL